MSNNSCVREECEKNLPRYKKLSYPQRFEPRTFVFRDRTSFQFHVTTEKSSTTFAAEMNQIHLHHSAPYKGDVFASLARNSV